MTATRALRSFMGRAIRAIWVLCAFSTATVANAAGEPFSLMPQAVGENVYALIGPTDPRTSDNHALNANFGFIVTPKGVILIDSGATRQGAVILETAVKSVTDLPVRWVINTGSQDHRWLGNGYFADQGATIIALARTVTTQGEFAESQTASLTRILGEERGATRPVHAKPALADDLNQLDLGGYPVQLIYFADAHFPGDTVVWLPEAGILFSGDLIYVDRMLGVLPVSRVESWGAAFEDALALQPRVIVPGHGQVTDVDGARRDTGAYLQWLLSEVGQAVEDWEPLQEVIDRLASAPQFSHLQHFDSWHRTNISRTFVELESR